MMWKARAAKQGRQLLPHVRGPASPWEQKDGLGSKQRRGHQREEMETTLPTSDIGGDSKPLKRRSAPEFTKPGPKPVSQRL